MKHLIIINHFAGKNEDLKGKIDEAFKGLDYQIYASEAPRSVIKYLKDYFKKEKSTVRVYACGGDGTLHEVVNGLIGIKNAELALYACGTGNDFAKVYGGQEVFLDFKKLISGKPQPIDISKLEGPSLDEAWYSINVINFGFDAIVGAKGNENKQKGISDPYGFTHAIVPALIHGRFNKTTVYADGEDLNGKKLLLASIAQGQYVGGEYKASPKSNNTDGLMDVVVLKTMSLMRLLIQYFGKYHDGLHLDSEKLMKRIYYRQAKEVEIKAPEDIDICVDGEMIRGKEFKVTCLPGAIQFVIPSKK
mgnify:CR=1 FL=1